MNDDIRKNQHNVPESYLKRFTFNSKNFYVFDKKLKKVFRSSTNKVASNKFYYDIPKIIMPDGVDNQIIEKKILQYVDTKYCGEINKLLKSIDDNNEFNEKLKIELSVFVFIQFYRTLHAKNLFKKSCEKELKEEALRYLKNKGKKVSEDDFEVKYNDTLIKLILHRVMLTPEVLDQVISILGNFIWLVAYNNTNLPFWTSDNPVTFKKYKNHIYKSPIQFLPDATELSLPLTPKYILIMLEKANNSQWLEYDCKKIDATYDNVIHYNSRYIGHYCKQIYSQSEDFDLAFKWCEEVPDIASRFDTNEV